MATCISLVKSGGKNHGKVCGRNTKDGKYCGYHRPKPKTDGRKTPKVLLSKGNLEKVESSKEHLKSIEENMIRTLDSKGMIFVWKCLCGKLVLSEDSVIMNRRDIFFGLGIKKSKRYKGCMECHSLMCAECSLEDDSCKVCNGIPSNWAEVETNDQSNSPPLTGGLFHSLPQRSGLQINTVTSKDDDDLKSHPKRAESDLSLVTVFSKDRSLEKTKVYRKVKSEVKFRRSRRQK